MVTNSKFRFYSIAFAIVWFGGIVKSYSQSNQLKLEVKFLQNDLDLGIISPQEYANRIQQQEQRFKTNTSAADYCRNLQVPQWFEDQILSHRLPAIKDINTSSAYLSQSSQSNYNSLIQSKIDAYRAQDLSRKDYLIKNYCSHHAGWVEKNPGTCQAGGPPPICPVDHWIEVGTDRAINQYYTDVANEKKRRIQEIENGSQQVKEALEVKDATITANAMNKKTTQIEKEYNKDNKALNKEMSKQAATLSGAVQNLNNMNNGISGFQGNVTSDEQWDEVYSKKNITNVNSIDNLADQGIKAAQNKTNEWINGNVNENVILDNLSNSSINPKFKLFSNGLKASNEVASKGLEILTEINEGNVRKLGERTLDATITNDFNKTISKFSYNQINDVADNVNSKVISELTNALTSENSDESVKNLERNFTPEGLLLSDEQKKYLDGYNTLTDYTPERLQEDVRQSKFFSARNLVVGVLGGTAGNLAIGSLIAVTTPVWGAVAVGAVGAMAINYYMTKKGENRINNSFKGWESNN